MALVGYARVSSTGQTLDVQRQKLRYCDKLFEEKQSGNVYARPQLKACMDYLREGDTLVITRLDRLARSTLHLCQIAEQLHKQDVHLRVIDRAKARGVQFGQKPKLTDAQVVALRELRAEGALIRELMDEFALSKSSVYRYLRDNVSADP